MHIMNRIPSALTSLAVTALAMLAVGCAGTLEEQKRIAYSAGFKVINPVKPDQVALLPTLPKDKVTPITYQGKTYYVLPDAENNQAFVGGPIEFRAYQKLCLEKEISDNNLAAAQMNQMAAMNWGAWGGWGAVAPYGPHGRVGRYGLR